MTLHHGNYVSVYDHNGKFECRGHIVGTYGLNPNYYDVQPCDEYSLKKRIHCLPAARIRAHYIAPHLIDTDPKHIKDSI